MLLHDLRRTAARNLRRAGVAEGMIMKIGGRKTRSVFERYDIVSQSDIQDAMTKLEAAHLVAILEDSAAVVRREGQDLMRETN